MLTDQYWSKLKRILLNLGVYNKANLRLTVEGIFYRMRVGCPWRDLPPDFGDWNKVYKRFNDWAQKGTLESAFEALKVDPDFEWKFIDGSVVKAHQHSTGAARPSDNAIGKSVAGNTTKIHMATDSFGLPVEFELTGGHVHDCKIAPKLIATLPKGGYTFADKGYDSQTLRADIEALESIPVIPRKSNSKIGNENFDWCLYKYRHLVENVFARLKHFRAIATRFDKLKRNDAGMLNLACLYLWLPL